jgi:oligoribonuclease
MATDTSLPNTPNSPITQPPAKPNDLNLVWIDMEMTGLVPETDLIIEVAAIVTDSELNVLAVSEAIAIHQSDEALALMDDWNQKTHGKSGLIARVKASTINEEQAQAKLLEFMKLWVGKSKTPMSGNSICQDRRFMARYMPELEAYFHYRNLDVSTVKELCKRWQPEIAKGFKKRSAHTAIADIEESIEELRYYRTHFLKETSLKPAVDKA